MLAINRSYFVIENNLLLIPLVILSVVITVLLINYLIVGIAALIISLLLIFYGERFLIGLIIVSLLTIVSDFGTTLRLFVQLINFSLLAFLFLKKYGCYTNAIHYGWYEFKWMQLRYADEVYKTFLLLYRGILIPN